MGAKQALAAAAWRAGISVRTTRSTDPWATIQRLVGGRPAPVVLDIGANLGQTAIHCAELLPEARIYSFEPSPSTYAELEKTVAALPNVTTFNVGVGERPGKLDLIENTNPDMTSFLRPGEGAWGAIVRETTVDVWTVDGFCHERDVDRVDVLKTDTQGFDLAVLRGAEAMLAGGSVDVILTEITFTPMYQGAPRFDELLGYVLDRGFRLVGLFVTHQDGLAAWADAVLAHERVLGH